MAGGSKTGWLIASSMAVAACMVLGGCTPKRPASETARDAKGANANNSAPANNAPATTPANNG